MRLPVVTTLAVLLAGCSAGTGGDGFLALSPAQVTVAQGASVTVTANFTSASATDTWTLTSGAPPQGVDLTFSSTLVRGGERPTLSVRADSFAAVGTSTIQVQAERDLLTAPATAEFSVTVVPWGTGGGAGGGTGGGSAGGAGGGGSAGGGAGGGTAGGGAGGGTATTTSNATIIVEPSDNGSALLQAIQGARSSVHMTMYILTNTGVINALIAQKNAGRDVKVLLNQSFPGGQGSNQTVFNQLQTAGVAVRWAPANFTYTHEKAVIVDGATAWIMTMNVAQSTASSNREYLAVDRDPADVADAEAIFTADWNGTAWTPSGKLVVAPVNARFSLVMLIGAATPPSTWRPRR